MEKLKTVDFFKILLSVFILWFHTVIFFYNTFPESKKLSKLNGGILNGDKALDFFSSFQGFYFFIILMSAKALLNSSKAKLSDCGR